MLLLIAVLGAVGCGVSLLARRSRRQRAAERRREHDLVARASYEDKLWAHGDDHGIYGEYPPDQPGRVPELGGQSDAPGRKSAPRGPQRPPAPSRADHGRQADAPSELEAQVRVERALAAQRRAAEQRALAQHSSQVAQQAARGRALMDQFVAMMRKSNVSTQTVFRECKGPTTITWDTVVGHGWPIGPGGTIGASVLAGWRPLRAGQQPLVTIFFMPGVGFAKVHRVQPGRETINVLVYPSDPDDSDQAYVSWADRGAYLASSAQSLIDGAT